MTMRGYQSSKRQSQHYSRSSAPGFLRLSALTPADRPDNFDWLDKLSAPKSQGACGSCWAFATTSAIEAHATIHDSQARKGILAPQQLVDCAFNKHRCGGNGGCEGSIAEVAMDYVAGVEGLTLEANYPYFATDQWCAYKAETTPPAVSITGYVNPTSNDADAVMEALLTHGPLTVAVDATHWGHYTGGVFNGCDYNENINLNHAVLLVGYGVDKDTGDKYWLIRNSWGDKWGENGNIRLRREDDLRCGTDSTPADGVACEGDNDP